jgi:hypothetical protein
MEGKTVLAGNIANKQEGRKVLILNYDNKQNLLFSKNPQSLINFLVIQILEST